jgi:hypothetical protein
MINTVNGIHNDRRLILNPWLILSPFLSGRAGRVNFSHKLIDCDENTNNDNQGVAFFSGTFATNGITYRSIRGQTLQSFISSIIAINVPEIVDSFNIFKVFI